MRPPTDSLLRSAIILAVVVVLLRWSWDRLQPLLPILAVAFVVMGIARAISAYRKYW